MAPARRAARTASAPLGSPSTMICARGSSSSSPCRTSPRPRAPRRAARRRAGAPPRRRARSSRSSTQCTSPGRRGAARRSGGGRPRRARRGAGRRADRPWSGCRPYVPPVFRAMSHPATWPHVRQWIGGKSGEQRVVRAGSVAAVDAAAMLDEESARRRHIPLPVAVARAVRSRPPRVGRRPRGASGRPPRDLRRVRHGARRPRPRPPRRARRARGADLAPWDAPRGGWTGAEHLEAAIATGRGVVFSFVHSGPVPGRDRGDRLAHRPARTW